MQLDLLLDPFGARWTEVRDAAAAAIDAGFAGIWTYDHLDGRVYDAPFVLECWTVLSALAVAAPGVMLGPLVLNVPNRHPGVLATMAATLQEVSGGRLLLGLGAGGGAGQSLRARAGGDRADDRCRIRLRRAQVELCVEEVRRLWQQSRVPGARSRAAVRDRCLRSEDGRARRACRRWHQHERNAPAPAGARRDRARRARAFGPRSGAVPGHASTLGSTSGGLPPTRRLAPISPPSARTASSSTCRPATTGAASPRRAACSGDSVGTRRRVTWRYAPPIRRGR